MAPAPSPNVPTADLEHWRLAIAPGGVPVLALEQGNVRAELTPLGAQLLTFENVALGRSMFWMDGAPIVPGRGIRGGVPLVLPWFGVHKGRSDFAKHGFARNMLWAIAGEFREADGYGIALELADSDFTRVLWPHAFRARLETVVFGDAVVQRLAIRNVDRSALSYECGFHPYFAVGDVRAIAVDGLDGAPYVDKAGGGSAHRVQQGPVRFAGEVDSVFVGTTSTLRIREAGRPTIRVEKTNSRETVVWNPGSKTANPADAPPFVCVEPMNCYDHPVALAPGEEHVTAVRYAWEG